jgi:eukaryotic-like serine/threonine-protein kinase
MILSGVVTGATAIGRATEMLGPYRLLSRLGAGGMGEVWRALDTGKDREVAIKMLGAWLGREPGFAARFRREAALAARLNAPNIIPIHDYGEIDGQLFMEMPLINGTNLDALVARHGALDPMRTVGVIEQIAEALDSAHAGGLVHRDVKPSNVLIAARRGGGDFVYLIDFGIACTADGTKITATGREPGTFAYMAPERFEGVSDPRGDIYALACVLFQALTGQDPYVPPDGACELPFYVNAHLRRPPPAPSAQRSTIPVAFDDVVACGMAKDPDTRFPTAGALAMAARAALATAPRRAAGRREAELVNAPSSSSPTMSPPAMRGDPSPAVPPDGDHQLTGHTSAVFAVATAQLDGVPVVISGGGDATVRVWDLATGIPIGSPFTGHAGAVHAVATVQLDGRPVVVSGGEDKTVRVWDMATGTPVGSPFTGHTYAVCALATAQLGGRPVVVCSSLNDTVRIWDLATGKTFEPRFHTLEYARRRRRVLAVATAQSDGRVVAVCGGADKTVRIWDLATGTPVGPPFTGHTHAVRAVAAASLHGRAVAVSASDDQTVRAWDLASGIPVGSPLTGHTGLVHAVATGRLGGRPLVVSGSHDKTVRVWDLARGVPVGDPLTGHTGVVHAVATGRLGGRPLVVSASHDKTVRVWDLAARTQCPAAEK